MSFLTRTTLRSRTTLCLVSNPSRPFHITSARAALSESDHSKRAFLFLIPLEKEFVFLEVKAMTNSIMEV